MGRIPQAPEAALETHDQANMLPANDVCCLVSPNNPISIQELLVASLLIHFALKDGIFRIQRNFNVMPVGIHANPSVRSHPDLPSHCV
jgi:hypothetical protein